MFDLSPLFAGFFIAEWAVRILMLFVVPHKQRTSTANAWLLLIMIAPMLGTILYYMFGNPKLPKSRREKLHIVKTITAKELKDLELRDKKLFATLDKEDNQSIAKLATSLGGLPPMKGNSVEFYSEYDETFVHIAKAIDNATDYVHVQYFIASQDSSTVVVLDAIERAVQRGVKVRFMYDKILSKRYGGNADLRNRLYSIGVEVIEMLPLSLMPGKRFTRPDLRNHRKIVIVDGHIAFTGSQNLIGKTYGRKDDLYYEELVAKLSGPVVWQLNNAFRSDWYAETGQPLLDIMEDRDMPPQSGSTIAQALPSGPNQDHDNNLKIYSNMVHTAKKSVQIVVPYFIPDESLLIALTTAAQRGVDVSIINSETIDKIFAGHAQRSYYEELLKVGVKIYLYKKPVFLHAKQVIIDDEVVIFGSSNLDIRSFELDFEINIIIYDATVVRKLKEIDGIYKSQSKEITQKNWAKRPLHLKLLDRFTRLASAFL